VKVRVEAAFQAHVEKLCRRYHVSVYDGRTALADEQFLDNQHADVKGSQRFSVRLSAQPVIREQLRRMD
jgi:hypothetical protein